MSSHDPLLVLDQLSKWFYPRKFLGEDRKAEPIKAVNEVSFDVAPGEIFGLVGESGCGKSTLCRCIMQLLRPTSGRILLEGRDLSLLSRDEVRTERLNFQMVFQDPHASLNPRMTVSSTLSEAIRTRHPESGGDELRDRIEALLKRVGLDPSWMRKYPHEFSGGQRQRIAIARSLAPEPKLILADEPVSALDVSIQSQILNLLKELRSDLGVTMLFISHDLSVVRYMADRLAVMERGRIVETGDSEEIFRNPQHAYTQKLLAAIPRVGRTG